ncbi:MAG: choice-of-anchor B family protein [Planctomycetota bacterium]
MLLALTAWPAAQTASNTALLGRFDPVDDYNDVWGYVAPDGREYALLGANNGTYVLDCTDPTIPTERAFIAGPRACCRDIRTYRDYAYVVSDAPTGGALQIIRLTDPDNPVLVNEWSAAFTSAHNVTIDTTTGRLYASGTTGPSPIVDIATDPENPVAIGSMGGTYIHDMQVQNGVAHVARIFDSEYQSVDVSNPTAVTGLGTASVTVAHNAWPTRDDRFVVTCSESRGGFLSVFDISNPRLPRLVSTWRTGPSTAVPHNALLLDRVAHVSWYGEGYRVLDLADPANPVEIGFFDDSTAGGFLGNWGVYPFQPSGVVYLSDRQLGFYTLDVSARSTRYGEATPGTGGIAPTIRPFGAAYRGNPNFELQMEAAPPGAAFALLLGVRGPLPVGPGLQILIDLSQPFFLVNGVTDASGNARIGVPIPAATPAVTLAAQFFAVDPAGAFNLTATRGLEFAVFAP